MRWNLPITCYQQALEVRTHQALPIKWAQTMNNLANAYWKRIKGERADNIEQAISYHRQALEVHTRAALPVEWAETMNGLALALQDRIKGERADNIEQAISCYQGSLEVRTPDALPYDCRRTTYALGRLLYDEGRFAEARDAFVMAHKAVEFMRGEAKREESKRRLAEENASLYARLVHSCLVVGDQKAAFEYATAGKGRTFVDLLESVQIDLSNLPDPLAEKMAQARQLKAQLDAVSGQLLRERPNIKQDASLPQQLSEAQQAKLIGDLKRLRQQDKKVWEEIREQFPDYFATQSAELFTLEEAQGLASQLDATLVSYYRHAKEWVAFVIRPDLPADASLKVVKLSVKDKQLREWPNNFNSDLADRALIN